MDLEKVAIEAVKVKIQELFDEILVSTAMEGKDIVIRISLPSEIMNKVAADVDVSIPNAVGGNLDKEAQAAAADLLGDNQGGEITK